MKLKLISVGKTTQPEIQNLSHEYEKRLGHYCKFEQIELPALKASKVKSEMVQKKKEGEKIVQQLKTSDLVVLLDENGKPYSSVNFSRWLQKRMLSGKKQLIFIIGGPYGFSEEVYKRADFKISLSPMTFSHQMIRAFFTEQLYRAFTILKNEPYHHS
jgi:23S rRNA (pseudouridine1915-N3)-methyltransferase